MLIGDKNPLRHIRMPYVTIALIVINVLIFMVQMLAGPEGDWAIVQNFGMKPSILTGQEYGGASGIVRIFSYQFLHGDLWHLLGNMFALYAVGDNVEDAMGHERYLGFYLLGGIAAAVAQTLFVANPYVPMVGASGSIAALFGAYLLMHPTARFYFLFIVIPIAVPAWLFFGFWFVEQIIGVLSSNNDGIAWWAHLGGMAFGVLFLPLLKQRFVPLDPMFAALDFWHRTPAQRKWRSYRRDQRREARAEQQAVDGAFREQRRSPEDPIKAAFKQDYRAYLDSMMSRAELDSKWGEGSAREGRATGRGLGPESTAPEIDAPNTESSIEEPQSSEPEGEPLDEPPPEPTSEPTRKPRRRSSVPSTRKD